MSVTLVNASGYQWGIEAEETGINIRSYTPTFRPEFKEFLYNKQNEKIGFAAGETETEFSIEGEVKASDGLMAANFVTAVTVANDHLSVFGVPASGAGGIYLDEATQPQERGAWRSVTFRASRNKGIT